MNKNIHSRFAPKHNVIRLALMNFIIENKRPFHSLYDGVNKLPVTEMAQSTLDEGIDILCANEGLVKDTEGRVNFVYPVSSFPTHHTVRLANGKQFFAMCAIDAIGAAFTLQQDILISSHCSGCGAPVQVQVKDGVIAAHFPPSLHALSFTLEEISHWAGSC